MAEFGIWTTGGGGFSERGLHSHRAAVGRLAEIIRDSEDPETDRADLKIEELCPDHADDEQPRDGCEEC